MSKKSPKRNTPFQSCHAVEFGLQVCERSAGTSSIVVTTVYQFYEVFGKEESVLEINCSCSDCVKYSEAPFQKDNFSSHNKRIHSDKCTEYCDL